MNRCWEAICAAIGKSLLGNTQSIETDWKPVFEETKKQGITGIVYSAVADLLPADLKTEWKYYNIQDITHSVQLLYEQKQLLNILNTIPVIILKGTAAAIYYPKPQLRSMGDVDFIVPSECFGKAKEILIKNGYDVSKEKNPRHICLTKRGIMFEMHHHFGHDKMDIDSFIDRCYGKLETGAINETEFPMLPKLENGLVLLAHLRQHLFTGIGIRQILDWMMYVNAVVDDEYWEKEFCWAVKDLGLERLAIVTTRLCQIYFGLSNEYRWCGEAENEICKRLMESIIDSGNFGHKHGNGKNVEATLINFRREGVLKYLQKAGEYNWKAYHQHHWLKPFAWCYQIGRFILQGVSTGRNKSMLKKDILRSSERYKLLKDLGL